MIIEQLNSIEEVMEFANSITTDFDKIKNIRQLESDIRIKNPANASSLSSILKNLNRTTLVAKRKFLEETNGE